MKKQNRSRHSSTANILRLPAFSWSGRKAFSELRDALAREQRRPVPYEELGTIMGVAKTTTHRWLEELQHPNIMGLFACLERLPAIVRQRFVDSRCRIVPDFDHPALAHSPAQTGKLLELLQKQRGLTVIAGSNFARGFVFCALGHASRRIYSNRQRIIGLELNRSDHFVPLEFCKYLEGAGLHEIQQTVLTIWPKTMTTSASMVMLNGVWMIEDLRDDILRLAGRAHVVLACAGTPDLKRMSQLVSAPVHLVSVFDSKRVPGGIRINCRQLKIGKSREKAAEG